MYHVINTLRTGCVLLLAVVLLTPSRAEPASDLFARENLVAWCVVPFDAKKRGPEERAAMLDRLGIKRLAYDWRAEHIATWDEELETLARHGIKLEAFWAAGELSGETQRILDLLARHRVKTQLWCMLGVSSAPVKDAAEQTQRVAAAAEKLRPLAAAAAKIGCRVAIYNHGGWTGEPANQIAVISALARVGVSNVGLVYNLHHGHEHLARFAELLAEMKPHLLALNLNGMTPGGDKIGKKILPIGQGEMDLELLRIIRASGWRGPVGILNHMPECDAEERLRDNLEGLEWLLPQLDGKAAGARPIPRS